MIYEETIDRACSCFLLFCCLLIFEDPRALYSGEPEMETVDLDLIFPEHENIKMVQKWVTFFLFPLELYRLFIDLVVQNI